MSFLEVLSEVHPENRAGTGERLIGLKSLGLVLDRSYSPRMCIIKSNTKNTTASDNG